MKKKIISLCIMMAFALQTAAPILATDNASIQNAEPTPTEVWVNGENILTDTDNTVDCGTGTATYKKDTNTLTLSNATITEGHIMKITGIDNVESDKKIGIYASSSINIVLSGTNKIGAEGSPNKIDYGILTAKSTGQSNNTNISGTGSLKITAVLGIVSRGVTTIDNTKVTIHGTKIGLSSSGSLTINNSEIEVVVADPSASIGIYSNEVISISGGSLKSSGSSIAMVTLTIETEETDATHKIKVDGLKVKDGKIGISSTGDGMYATSFIPETDSVLNDNLSNALNEIDLVPASTVSFDVNDGNEEDFKVVVPTGETVSEPTMIPTKDGHHFSGWYYLDDRKFDFAKTAITSDLTLKAKFEAHVPGADATIEHDQTCSVCGEVLKPKLPTKDVVVNEETENAPRTGDTTQLRFMYLLFVISGFMVFLKVSKLKKI